MDTSFVLKLSRIFRVPYGGEGVDFVDQLNYQFTSGLMIIFIAIIGLRQYVGKPIQCWVPQEFTTAWEDYAENICWVQNTYFLRTNETVPDSEADLVTARYVSYYQWVAIVLAAQAMIPWIPHILWRVWSKRVPILLRNAREAAVPDHDLRRKAVGCLIAALEEQAEASTRWRRKKGLLKCIICTHPASRVTMLFMFVRFLFIANDVSQIYLMRHFIGTNDTMFGLHMFEGLLEGNDWQVSGVFPRVTYCHVKIRKHGQIKMGSYTLQCVLPVNYFIEKVYIFLWFWFVMLVGLTSLNTLQWLFNLGISNRRVHFIRQYLKALKLISNTEESDCARFVSHTLGMDGVFLLQMVSKVSSDLIALDVTGTLWSNYRKAKITGTEDDIARFIESIHRGTSAV